MFVYKNMGPPARATSRYNKNRLTSLNDTYIYHTIKGPLRHPQLPLPQEEVAHPYQPQAVVVAHLQDHPAQVAGVHSS